MQGKLVVITGATSGIGQVAAERLAAAGAQVVVVARDPARGDATLARLRAAGPGAAHRLHLADLSSLTDMRRVGREIAAREPRIDLLLNNAGALYSERQITGEGWERTFALNHMAYYVLTHALRDRLLATPNARVINTTSEAHRAARPQLCDLQSLHAFSGMQAYCRSKLYNILFTRELARRWFGAGVSVNCFHPGLVASGFARDSNGLLYWLVRALRPFALTPEGGAQTLLHLATSADGGMQTGQYFARSRVLAPTLDAQDDEAALQLWTESARLAGIDPDTGWLPTPVPKPQASARSLVG